MPRQAGYRHHEDTRKKIQAAQIINRLEEHVFASEPILDASQVNAAKALLNKILPDLSSMSLEGSLKQEVTHQTKEQRDAAVAAATRADR